MGTGEGNKKTYVTEWGFNTDANNPSQSDQDAGMRDACSVIMSWSSVVKAFCWFQYGDNAGASLYYGLVDGNGNNKIVYNDFRNDAEFEGKTSSGAINNNIKNYFNSKGAGQVGGAYDNGGSARGPSWSGGRASPTM